MNIPEQVVAYLDDLRVARRVRPETERLYGFYLNRFLAFRRHQRAQGNEISPPHVSAFLAWISAESRARRGRELSDYALDKAFDVVRGFCRWSCDSGYMNQNPFRFLKPPIVRPKQRSVASRSVIRAMLDAIAAAPAKIPVVYAGQLHPKFGGRRLQPRPEGWRDRALCLRDAAFFGALYFGGLRISEACPLRLDQVNLEEGFISLEGKGGSWRVVPMHPTLRVFLRRWLRARAGILEKAGVTNQFLFITMPGRGLQPRSGHVEKFRMEHLLAWRYLPMIRGGRRGRGVPEKFTPHCFRHSVATGMLDRGTRLDIVQEFLGHRDINTTKIYTRIRPKQLRAAVACA